MCCCVFIKTFPSPRQSPLSSSSTLLSSLPPSSTIHNNHPHPSFLKDNDDNMLLCCYVCALTGNLLFSFSYAQMYYISFFILSTWHLLSQRNSMEKISECISKLYEMPCWLTMMVRYPVWYEVKCGEDCSKKTSKDKKRE